MNLVNFPILIYEIYTLNITLLFPVLFRVIREKSPLCQEANKDEMSIAAVTLCRHRERGRGDINDIFYKFAE